MLGLPVDKFLRYLYFKYFYVYTNLILYAALLEILNRLKQETWNCLTLYKLIVVGGMTCTLADLCFQVPAFSTRSLTLFAIVYSTSSSGDEIYNEFLLKFAQRLLNLGVFYDSRQCWGVKLCYSVYAVYLYVLLLLFS